MRPSVSTRFFSPCLTMLLLVSTLNGEESKRGLDAIKIADGFIVEQVAGPPVTERPLMGSFDEKGRLYLAESAGLNLDAAALMKQTPNFIRRLEDSDGDGTFDKSTVFADKMTFPMGALWHRGAVYSASPPYIWKLVDSNDDGVADTRDVFVGKFGFIGNAADIHGCFLAPNGRITWCDGRHGHEFVDENGQVQSKGKAARLFSCWLDGSDVFSHCGGGMDNPVEVDFTPEGEMLGVVNLFYPKRGDCLVHWLHGGAYPRQDQPLQIAEFKRTGDLLGPVLDFGHVAVSGTLRYRGKQLGDDATGNWFVCEFNTHKLVRVKLTRAGSSYSASVEEFLTSSDPDFHPTDVIEDADGSLLVIDTGGWFRNGCPTSQIAKPEITGAIYRIRRKDTSPIGPHQSVGERVVSVILHDGVKHDSKMGDWRGLKLKWEEASDHELLGRLYDPRPAVKERAIDTLAQRAEKDVDTRRLLTRAITSNNNPDIRLAALWANARTRRAVPVDALDDKDARIRQAAAVALQFTPDPLAIPKLSVRLSSDESPAVRREAAVALGRMKAKEAVPELLDALRLASSDRSLEHALIFALIEIDDREGTLAGLAVDNSQVRRASLIALDQMNSGALTRDIVVPLLDTEDATLQQAAIDIISKHQGWGTEVLGLLRGWLTDATVDPARASMIRGSLLAFKNDAKVQEFVGSMLSDASLRGGSQQLLLEVVARSNLQPLPSDWVNGVTRLLSSSDVAVLGTAIDAASVSPASFEPALRAISKNGSLGGTTRTAAAEVLAKGGLTLEEPEWKLVVAKLDPSAPALERMSAAEAIGLAKLEEKQRTDLVKYISMAGPVELPPLARAFERAPFDEKCGLAVVEAIGKSPGQASLSPSRLIEIFSSYPKPVQQAVKGLTDKLLAERGEQTAKIDKLVERISSADAGRGKDVFAGAKASCAACHAIGGQGGKIGPDLSKIGASRQPRDLLESVYFPSLSFARGFESYNVVTASGKVYSGIIARESTDAIWLRTADRSEVRIGRDEIDDLSPSQRSVMPEGLDKVLTEDELAELVAYLMTLK
ncbi:HEAT repeat domain-containing protein [bacterium]|nr:HEAT repeat domain-containing protein [bacterium]